MKTLTLEQIEPQTETHGLQTESQPTPTSDEAPATQTSVDEDQIVAQVVADINATSPEEEISNDGGVEEPCKSKFSPEKPIFVLRFWWIKFGIWNFYIILGLVVRFLS